MDVSDRLPGFESVIASAESTDGTDLRVDVGVLVARSSGADGEELRRFARQLSADVAPELGDATEIRWEFHEEEPTEFADGRPRRPSVFLDETTHRMVEGAYDVIVVVTDVALLSRRERYVPGLASPLARTCIVSTRNLLGAARGQSPRALDAPAVRYNAASLLLHLVGHVLGEGHGGDDDGVMAPFHFDPTLETVPRFDAAVERRLERIATEVPDEEARSRGRLRRLGFYVTSVARNPGEIGRALLNSHALLLPVSLPKLATAAVTPTLVIVFSAEAWDVGFHMSNATATLFAMVSIVAAATYLLYVQNLSFPRKRHRVVTEHTALVNVTIFLILVLAMVGLFLLVGSIMLVIELIVFPPNLMSNWPSLEEPAVGLTDLVRTAAFISTIGVLSGALAGGLESRAIIRHITLFRDQP